MQRFVRFSPIAALVLIALAVAACAVQLRGNEDRAQISERANSAPDLLATKLAECRSITYEQKDALAECRKAWAERRHQFLGQKPPVSSATEGSTLFAAPKDESRLPSGYPPIQQPAKE